MEDSLSFYSNNSKIADLKRLLEENSYPLVQLGLTGSGAREKVTRIELWGSKLKVTYACSANFGALRTVVLDLSQDANVEESGHGLDVYVNVPSPLTHQGEPLSFTKQGLSLYSDKVDLLSSAMSRPSQWLSVNEIQEVNKNFGKLESLVVHKDTGIFLGFVLSAHFVDTLKPGESAEGKEPTRILVRSINLLMTQIQNLFGDKIRVCKKDGKIEVYGVKKEKTDSFSDFFYRGNTKLDLATVNVVTSTVETILEDLGIPHYSDVSFNKVMKHLR